MDFFEDDEENNQFNIVGDQDWAPDIQSDNDCLSISSQIQYNFDSCFKQDEQMNEECDIKNNDINTFTHEKEEQPNQNSLIIDNSFKEEKEKYIEKEEQKLNTDENIQIFQDIFKNPEQPTKEENEIKDNHVLKPAIEPDIKKNEVKKKAAKKNKFSKMFNVHKIDSENVNIYIPIKVPKANIFGKNKKKFTFQIFKQGRKRKRKLKGRIKGRLFDKDNIRKKFQIYVFNEIITNKLNDELRKNKIVKKFNFPQSLITNVTVKQKEFLDMTIKELLLDEHKYEKEKGKKDYNISNAKENKKIIQSLKDKNIENIDNILEKKLKDVYNECGENLNFEETKIKLNEKKNEYSDEYVSKYIEVAKNIVKDYEEKKPKKK